MMLSYRSAVLGNWRFDVSSNSRYIKDDSSEFISWKVYRNELERRRNNSRLPTITDSRNLYSEGRFSGSDPVGAYPNSRISDDNNSENQITNNDQLSSEISKLNELRQTGVLTEEEFEKAKKKLLNN